MTEMPNLWEELRNSNAEDLIRRFDVDFDIPSRRNVCIGLLLTMGAYEGSADPAIRAGAWWCRMVHHDVEYQILQGLEAIAESRGAAEAVKARLDRGAGSAFDAYVYARWNDGVGKIHYRCGDMTEARLSFERAVKLAEDPAWRDALARCLPDFRSNVHRADYEEQLKVGVARATQQMTDQELNALRKAGLERLASNYEPHIAEARTSRLGASLPAAIEAGGAALLEALKRQTIDPAPAKDDLETREFYRGVSSLLHNQAIAVKDTERARSLELSWQSAALCFLQGDHYRLGQALKHRADMLGSAAEETRKESNWLLSSLADGKIKWKRGQWLARQTLARRLAEGGDVKGGIAQISEIFKALRERRRSRGGDLGFDVDVLAHSTRALEEIVGRGSAELKARCEGHLRSLRLDAARAVRGVVKVSTYKQRYAGEVFPLYLRAVAELAKDVDAALTKAKSPPGQESRRSDEGAGESLDALLGEIAELAKDIEGTARTADQGGDVDWMDLASLVEEVSSRELLDVLASSRRDERPRAPKPLAAGVSPEPVAEMGSRGRRGAVERRAGEAGDVVDREVARQRTAADERALHRPIQTTPHNDEIGTDLRRFTSQRENHAIVRYFLQGWDARRGQAEALRAMVFINGRPAELCDLDITEVKQLARSLAGQRPSRAQAKALWEHLLRAPWEKFAPHLKKEAGGAGGEPKLRELTLIPCTDLFALPLQCASVPQGTAGTHDGGERPLGCAAPLAFSVSATAYVTRARHLLRVQPVDPTDDLCALVPDPEPGRAVKADELLNLGWKRERFWVAGRPPAGLPADDFQTQGDGDRDGLLRLMAKEPEFFAFAGHGTQVMIDGSPEVALLLHGTDVLSQYDIASLVQLPRNKWTLLGACVSGQGVDSGGGEVAGFIRSFMAAGAGAIGATLWEVDNDLIAAVLGGLLQRAVTCRGTIDVVEALREIQATQLEVRGSSRGAGGRRDLDRDDLGPDNENLPEHCPVVLYL